MSSLFFVLCQFQSAPTVTTSSIIFPKRDIGLVNARIWPSNSISIRKLDEFPTVTERTIGHARGTSLLPLATLVPRRSSNILICIPSTVDWWVTELEKFYDLVPYDGIWIDMNEPSNFQDGSFQGCPDNTLENPPFVPKMSCECGDMLNKTICMSSIIYPFGENEEPVNHYDAHSLYGHSMSAATKVAADAIYSKHQKRSWLITRSNFVGSGHYAGHWLGDNYGTEVHLQNSIK